MSRVLFLSRREQPCCIEEEGQLGGDVNKGCQKRVEKASRGQADADGIDNQSTVEVLQDDPPAVARDANSINEFGEIVADQNHIGAFPSDIRSGPHRYTNTRLAECRCVIDAVSQHSHRSTFFPLSGNESSLLFREK